MALCRRIFFVRFFIRLTLFLGANHHRGFLTGGKNFNLNSFPGSGIESSIFLAGGPVADGPVQLQGVRDLDGLHVR